MRYICGIFAILGLACGTLDADEAKKEPAAPQEKVVEVDSDKDGIVDMLDIFNLQGKLIRREYDTNGDRVMDRYQNYNPNTGLPDVVASDKMGELR